MPKCSLNKCTRRATWVIEIRRNGAVLGLMYACDEHRPNGTILSPNDEIRRL